MISASSKLVCNLIPFCKSSNIHRKFHRKDFKGETSGLAAMEKLNPLLTHWPGGNHRIIFGMLEPP